MNTETHTMKAKLIALLNVVTPENELGRTRLDNINASTEHLNISPSTVIGIPNTNYAAVTWEGLERSERRELKKYLDETEAPYVIERESTGAVDEVKESAVPYTYDRSRLYVLLIDYMSRLSQEYYSAGWGTDWGFTLWEIVQGTNTNIKLRPSELLELHRLSTLAGGWAEYVLDGEDLRARGVANSESHEWPQFIPMNAWLTFYEQRERA